MNMYERFAKKYGSLADEEDDDSFEQGMESDPSVSDAPDPLFTEVVPGPRGKVEEVKIPQLPPLPSFEDTEEEDDDSFEQGMGTDFPDEESIPSTLTPMIPGKRGKRLSNNQIVKLCDYFYDLATS
jgi:hypothetical protein